MGLELPAIEVVSDSEKRVELTASLDETAAQPSVQLAVISQLGAAAAERGARHALPKGLALLGEGLHLEQFSHGRGDSLTAIAKCHVKTAEGAHWRAQVFCHEADQRPGAAHLVAEVTQRFRYVRAAEAQAASSDDEQASSRPREKEAEAKGEGVADRRRQQIFEGACEVIAKKGWANASIRDITRAAKITIPTMYQYISGKEDILYLVTSICMEEILDYFRTRINDDKPPIESLADVVTAYFQYIDKNRRYINLLYSETRSLNEENRAKIFRLEKQFVQLWEAILVKGNESGVFDVKNTDLAANLIYFLCTSWSLRHWNIGRYDEAEVREQIMGMILHGIQNAGGRRLK